VGVGSRYGDCDGKGEWRRMQHRAEMGGIGGWGLGVGGGEGKRDLNVAFDCKLSVWANRAPERECAECGTARTHLAMWSSSGRGGES
jgi:hypothetical protein